MELKSRLKTTIKKKICDCYKYIKEDLYDKNKEQIFTYCITFAIVKMFRE